MSSVQMESAPTRESAAGLSFALLLYSAGGCWLGRSVLTGHVSEGKDRESALQGLVEAVDASMYAAGQMGQGRTEWYRAQRPDETRFLRMFATAVTRRHPEHSVVRTPSGYAIELSVATLDAG